MTFALEIYNSSGVKTLSTSDALTKYVGSFNIPELSPNGSVVFPALAGGRPFAAVLRLSTSPFRQFAPLITFSGTTVYWTFGLNTPPYGNNSACQVIVGTY
jgi:hypothetical protein